MSVRGCLSENRFSFEFFITFTTHQKNKIWKIEMEMDLRVRSTEFQQQCLVNFLNDFFHSFIFIHFIDCLDWWWACMYIQMIFLFYAFIFQFIIPQFFLHKFNVFFAKIISPHGSFITQYAFLFFTEYLWITIKIKPIKLLYHLLQLSFIFRTITINIMLNICLMSSRSFL